MSSLLSHVEGCICEMFQVVKDSSVKCLLLHSAAHENLVTLYVLARKKMHLIQIPGRINFGLAFITWLVLPKLGCHPASLLSPLKQEGTPVQK